MIGKRELFCPSIKGKDLEQTVEITEIIRNYVTGPFQGQKVKGQGHVRGEGICGGLSPTAC